jgi:hypothetical protein
LNEISLPTTWTTHLFENAVNAKIDFPEQWKCNERFKITAKKYLDLFLKREKFQIDV